MCQRKRGGEEIKGEGGREGERERERERERETERQRDRERQRQRQRQRQRERQTERQTETRDRETKTQTGKQTHRQTEVDAQTYRQAETYRKTDRPTLSESRRDAARVEHRGVPPNCPTQFRSKLTPGKPAQALTPSRDHPGDHRTGGFPLWLSRSDWPGSLHSLDSVVCVGGRGGGASPGWRAVSRTVDGLTVPFMNSVGAWTERAAPGVVCRGSCLRWRFTIIEHLTDYYKVAYIFSTPG